MLIDDAEGASVGLLRRPLLEADREAIQLDVTLPDRLTHRFGKAMLGGGPGTS